MRLHTSTPPEFLAEVKVVAGQRVPGGAGALTRRPGVACRATGYARPGTAVDRCQTGARPNDHADSVIACEQEA